MLSLSVGAKPRKGWACGLPLIAAAEPLHMSRTAFACQRDVTSTPEARANRFTFSSCRSGPVGLVFCVLRGLKLQTYDCRLRVMSNDSKWYWKSK